MKLIDAALKENRHTLSEYESKQILQDYAIPITSEILVSNIDINPIILSAGKPIAVDALKVLEGN